MQILQDTHLGAVEKVKMENHPKRILTLIADTQITAY
jgi:hypothetical protein